MARYMGGALLLITGIVAMLWFTMPRLVTEFRHAKEFVPAQNWKPTGYKCTNWNAVMFNECTVTYQSTTQTGVSQSFTDWRFGRAPHEGIVLLQQRDHPATVTTDVSLRTFWNRLALAMSVVAFGALALVGFALKAKRVLDAPDAVSPLDRRPSVA